MASMIGGKARHGPPASSRVNGTKFRPPREVDAADHISTAKWTKANGHTAEYLAVSRAALYRYLADDAAA
jgi:hypothetical protein